MNAPLSRYLTQFSTPSPPPVVVAEMPMPFAPMISLTAVDLAARIEGAATAARSEIELQLRNETEALLAENEIAATRALEAAREEWTSAQADRLTAQITEAMSGLCATLADTLARVLRPIVSESLVARATREVGEALDKLLSDADCPMLSLQGPADLIGALRQRCGATSIEWIEAETTDATILASATRLETHLGTALAAISATDS